MQFHQSSSQINNLFGALLGKKDGVNVGQDTSRSNSNSSQQFVEFFIILDGKSNVTGHDTALLVIASSVSGKLENLGTEVLKDSSQVHGSSGSHAGGVLSLTQVTSDTTDRELKSRLGTGSCAVTIVGRR